MKKFVSTIALGVVLSTGVTGVTGVYAAPIDLSGVSYYTYGNSNSYSLPLAAYAYDQINGGGVGPGNPYYVPSGVGQIKDLVVIYTGASGTPVTTNSSGFDNAYGTPNGSSPQYASIDGAVNVNSPGDKAGIANNNSNTWDASLLALKGFLDGGNPVFMFNNNDTNEDQHLAVWAKLWLTAPDNSVYNGRYLYLSNQGAAYGLGGTPLGDASIYNPGDVLPSAGNLAATDYVLSGGDVCVDAGGAVVSCAGPYAVKFNHNLGANQVAYAADVPLLDDWLSTLFALDDATLDGFTMHLDLRLGCAAEWLGDCSNLKIDNGFEQLFLTSSLKTTNDVPEPNMLALMALSLLALGALRRRANS